MSRTSNEESATSYLPVDVQAVQPQVLEQLHSRLRELLPSIIRARWLCEVRGVRPASNRQQDLQVPIPFLQKIELLAAPAKVLINQCQSGVWLLSVSVPGRNYGWPTQRSNSVVVMRHAAVSTRTYHPGRAAICSHVSSYIDFTPDAPMLERQLEQAGS
jgi:hypothetical protein